MSLANDEVAEKQFSKMIPQLKKGGCEWPSEMKWL